MNEALKQTAIFIRDLLDYSESLIRIGRQNYDIDDFTTAYIGVDSLGPAMRLASGEEYDGDAEVMTYNQHWRAPITISFYGDGAWARANKFSLLIRSQASHELQMSQGISVLQASGITDVKILAGQEYGERYEMELNVLFNTTEDVVTKRVDTARLEVLPKDNPTIEIEVP